MGNLFGRKKTSRVTEHDKAVLQVKQQRDRLKQYQQRIEKILEDDRELARKLIADGRRERAKLLLRKKRFQEQLLDKTDGQLENLERLVHDLEFAQVELRVVEGLKVGNEALKKVNAMLSVEDIERILDETKEGVEKQKEINELLSGVLTTEDEDAVEAELVELLKMADEEQLNAEEAEVALPDVPSGEPHVPTLDAMQDEKIEKKKAAAKKRVALAAE